MFWPRSLSPSQNSIRMRGWRTFSPGCSTKCVAFMPAVTRRLPSDGAQVTDQVPVQPRARMKPESAPAATLKNGV